MAKRNKKLKNEIHKLSTQIVEVVLIDDAVKSELLDLMERLGIVRSEAYNKLGSVRHWGMDWHKAYPEVRDFRTPESLGLPSKLMEWTVNDVAKAILAQQAATIANLSGKIWARYPGKENEDQRKQAYRKLNSTEFLSDSFLSRIVRDEFQRGHTSVDNQIVYQPQAYTSTRLSRYVYRLSVSGLTKGKRVEFNVRSNRKPSGQIRVIYNYELERFEVHFLVDFGNYTKSSDSELTPIGIDKGYTEAFIDSNEKVHGDGLGELLTKKSNRITKKNRKRGKIFAIFRKNEKHDPVKAARILENNLSRKTENKRYRKDQAAISSLLGQASKSLFATGSLKVFAEDLTESIKNKSQSKAMSRKLNSWVKGCMRDSLEKWASWSNSTITEVNAAYTSQTDAVTLTLLGKRDGNRFTRHTGVVVHSDCNAAKAVLHRGTDKDITRYMRSSEVQAVLLRRTAMFLALEGKSLDDAVELDWLDSKHKKNPEFQKLVSGSLPTTRKTSGRSNP
ncbi:transposase [Iningainema tapete]|uniref:Transposase n=1 Tax=Iningainema tapete BLCC-T55 TaxID=2748662 RepID=A0A8J6XF13_9CYAN|nr:transposase [Iningainema tapete]MBD2775385.1 transposase [Iningainema tapete BLCC-T55]